MRSKRLALPPTKRWSNSGHIVERQSGYVNTLPAGKPPKLRFSPGMFLFVEGQLWEIVYAFRVADQPNEWLYCLEERTILSSKPTNEIGKLMAGFGLGDKTPRIVYEVFRSAFDAHHFFAEIPANTSRKTFTNQMLLQGKAEIRSSGEVIDPK
jgi:hypothetical protein